MQLENHPFKPSFNTARNLENQQAALEPFQIPFHHHAHRTATQIQLKEDLQETTRDGCIAKLMVTLTTSSSMTELLTLWVLEHSCLPLEMDLKFTKETSHVPQELHVLMVQHLSLKTGLLSSKWDKHNQL